MDHIDWIIAQGRAGLSRRRFIGGMGVTLAAAAFLAACGDEAGDATATPSATAGTGTASATPEATAASVFPLTVTHKLGTTQVPAAPQRVVSVGFTDQDYLLAFGVVPVGIREWFGAKPSATWPWAQDLLGSAQPAVLPRLELDFEQITALQPDLIVGIYAGMTSEEYATLSQIAPTIAGPAGVDDYQVTWQEQTRLTGRALGQSEQAEALVTALESRIKQTAAEHPEFNGATFVMVSASGGEYYLYGSDSTSALFLSSLGLRLPEAVEAVTSAEGYLVITPERFDLLDADLVIWYEGVTDEGPTALLAEPTYQSLPAHQEGRDLFLGFDLYAGAFSFSSILSLQLLLDDLVPAMTSALDGNPTTEAVLGAA